MNEPTRFALLDVDGTLYPGTLGLALLDGLASAGLCDRGSLETITAVSRAFRSGQIDFQTMVERIYQTFASSLTGRSCAAVEDVAREVWRRERDRLFPFVPALVETLRRRGYQLLLVSGSPTEMIRLLAEELEAEGHHGVKCGRRGGRYTGGLDALPGCELQKRRIFLSMTRGREIRLEECFAMGNSMSDVALLEMVGKPVAFEPEPDLLALARSRSWVVTHRDDVLSRATALLDQGRPRNVEACALRPAGLQGLASGP